VEKSLSIPAMIEEDQEENLFGQGKEKRLRARWWKIKHLLAWGGYRVLQPERSTKSSRGT